MEPGSPEHAAALEQLTGKLASAAELQCASLVASIRQTVALTYAVTLMARELDRAGILNRAALAAEAVEALRTEGADDPEQARAVRDLFGVVEPPIRPTLRLIRGGKR